MITPFQLEVRQYIKAVVGGLLAALALLGGALGDGLSSAEVIGLVVAFLGGFIGVFASPNLDPKGVNRTDLSTQPGFDARNSILGDKGRSTLEIVLIVLAVVLVIFFLIPLLGGLA